MDFSFRLQHQSGDSAARCSALATPHGTVNLPAFMPVGTLGTVKGLTSDQLQTTGTEMVLANAYHLALRPGTDEVRTLGGLHQFMGWSGPILTDSGGYQIFSLAHRTRITEQGATFQSHIDGKKIELTPERAVAIQEALGSDVAMVLDHVIGLPSSRSEVALAMERSLRWAARCRDAMTREDQILFGIVQGGLEADFREESAKGLVALDFPGYAIGGLSVGESHQEMVTALDATLPHLPEDRTRYLMGVGRPEDLLEAILRGVDLFDCVLPTRSGRHGAAFTDGGLLRLKNEIHRGSDKPLEEGCPCVACRHSRGYLRHLLIAGEMLGPVLLSIHNVTYYQRLLRRAREAILADRLAAFCRERYAAWGVAGRQKAEKESPTADC